LLIMWIRTPREKADTSRGERKKPRVSEGLMLLWSNPLIRTLALLGSAMNALWTGGVRDLWALCVARPRRV
jgi:hypothetical protein